MRERRVGIRELKSKLSECIQEVKRGTTVVVTDHGRRVARIIPETDSTEQKLAALKASGTIVWSGRQLKKREPRVQVQDGGTVSDIVIANRR
jgi:prevent-host-death family protein